MQGWGHQSEGIAVADVPEVLFQPVFENPKVGEQRGPEERDDAAAIKTYRYLRLGMVVIVIALLSSVLIQRWNSGCWQGSISAYYYTPARPVFVSGLLAIGVSLIVIKGSTWVEDLLLNFAGTLAPIVAFVPTSFEPACASSGALSSDPTSYPVKDVQNNIGALLVAGLVAFLLAVIVFVVEQNGDDKLATRHVRSRVTLLAFTALLLAVGAALLASDKILDYHGWSAVAMFGLLALASVFNGIWLYRINHGEGEKTSLRWKAFARLYIAVGAVMAVAGVIIRYVWPDPWDHRILVLEIVEIGLFATMWVVQSVERWGKILQAKV
jgi:hypothetical protein